MDGHEQVRIYWPGVAVVSVIALIIGVEIGSVIGVVWWIVQHI